MQKIRSDIDPTLDALAKLYTMFTTQAVKFKSKDEDTLRMISDAVYALDKPQEHEFSPADKKIIERLWNEYSGV